MNLFTGEHRGDAFMKINPQHTVPTIDDNGFVMWESRAISAYLTDAKAHGSPLYPTEAKARAIVDQRLYFDAGTLWPRIMAIAYPAFFAGATTIPDDKRKALVEAFEYLNTYLQGNNWVAGNHVTIADLAILASVSSVHRAGFSLAKYANVAAWYERTKSLPGWAENDEGAKIYGDKVSSLLKDDKF